jgi:hypothetical protein
MDWYNVREMIETEPYEDYREPTQAEIEALARKAELSDPFGIDADTYRKAG